MSHAEISIQGVDRRFGSFVALRQVNLEITHGEVHVLLGPSGCGKTTLLRMIAGFEQPDAGRILHAGQPVLGPEPRRGFVFQENVHFPWRTVIRNVEFGLEMGGMQEGPRRARAQEFLKLVGLDGFGDFFPSQISGGMKQRMVLATVLANDPAALLMDEPFAALDAQTRTNMQKELVRIWAETRKTVVFVTHSIREALVIGSRISLFKTRPGEVKRLFDLDEMFGIQQKRQLADPRFGQLEAEIYEMMRHDEVQETPAAA
jgi:NitT/TauT family transport system ATP-binding protein